MKMFNVKKGAAVLTLLALSTGGFTLDMMGKPIDDAIHAMQNGPDASMCAAHVNKIIMRMNDWIGKAGVDDLSDLEYINIIDAEIERLNAECIQQLPQSNETRRELSKLYARLKLFVAALRNHSEKPAVVLGLQLQQFSDLLPQEFETRYSKAQVLSALQARKKKR